MIIYKVGLVESNVYPPQSEIYFNLGNSTSLNIRFAKEIAITRTFIHPTSRNLNWTIIAGYNPLLIPTPVKRLVEKWTTRFTPFSFIPLTGGEIAILSAFYHNLLELNNKK